MTPERWRQIEELYHAARERSGAGRGLIEFEHSPADQERPYFQKIWLIHSKHVNCDSADHCSSGEFRALPQEVGGPGVGSRMVEPDNLSGSRVDPSNIGPLRTLQ